MVRYEGLHNFCSCTAIQQEDVCRPAATHCLNFINHPAVLTIDDTDSIGFFLQTTVYYNTQLGYIALAFEEIVPTEAYLKADIKVVCNGETYQLTDHDGEMRTDKIEVKTYVHP